MNQKLGSTEEEGHGFMGGGNGWDKLGVGLSPVL